MPLRAKLLCFILIVPFLGARSLVISNNLKFNGVICFVARTKKQLSENKFIFYFIISNEKQRLRLSGKRLRNPSSPP